jgi:hypothetical protein
MVTTFTMPEIRKEPDAQVAKPECRYLRKHGSKGYQHTRKPYLMRLQYLRQYQHGIHKAEA